MNLSCQYSPRSQYLLLPATTHPKIEASVTVTVCFSQPRSCSTFAPTYQPSAGLIFTFDISHCFGHTLFLVGWTNKFGTIVGGGLVHLGLPAYLSARQARCWDPSPLVSV